MKKITTFLLCVILVVSMMPSIVFADSETITGTCGNDTITYTFTPSSGQLSFEAKYDSSDNLSLTSDDWSYLNSILNKYIVSELYIGEHITDINYVESYSDDGILDSLKKVSVATNNKVYSVDNNVLFKNERRTASGVDYTRSLALYPAGREGTKYTIPKGVEAVENSAFKECQNLETVCVPASVKLLGSAYGRRNQPLKFEFDGSLPGMLYSYCRYDSVFFKLSCTQYNEDVQARLKQSIEFGDVFLEHDFENGVCKNCKTTLTDPEPYIGPDYYNEIKYPIDKIKEQYYIFNVDTQCVDEIQYYDEPVTQIDIPSQIAGIDVKSVRLYHEQPPLFVRGNQYEGVTSLKIAAGIETVYVDIGGFGLKLKELELPDTVTFYRIDAVDGASSLEKLTFPISADSSAYESAKSLTTLIVTKGTGRGIDYDTASHKYTPWYISKDSLMHIQFKDGIEYVGQYTFAHLPNVKECDLPSSIKEVGDNAFYRNESLKTVVLHEGIQKVGYQSFAENESLTSVTLPESLTDIKYNSFDGCPNLVLTVVKDSYGQKYAEKYNIPYRIGDNGTVIDPSDSQGSSSSGGNTVIIGGGSSDAETPTIGTGNGAYITMSKDGTTANITLDDGYEIIDVILNGISLGKVTTVMNLKTGDKLSVITESPAEKLERLKAGVRNTTIKISSSSVSGAIKLTWTKSKGYKVDGYEIYRSKGNKRSFKKYGTTKKTSYKNAKNLKKGTRYYYKVRGYRVIAGEKVYTKWSKVIYRTAR